MNILLIGSGGREHALAWRLTQSAACDKLFAAPGNPGIAEHAELVALDVTDDAVVLGFCRTQSIGLVIIGPEAPLVAGLADDLRAGDIAVFGPSAAAARLEGSKGFTKDLCARANIPTARYVKVASHAAARASLDDFTIPVVVKADGLAAGKGVTVAMTRAEAEQAIDDLFSVPGAEAVIEEFLEGEEVSLFVLTDGTAIMPFGTAQDHKRVGDGDTGPNTGGMGAYSPASVLTRALEQQAIDAIIQPTLAELRRMGCPYSGVLYAGLMLTADGPKLIEYNARFGDPECQVLMLRLESDLAALLLAVAQGVLADQPPPPFSSDAAVTVVLATNGYPGAPETGGAIGDITAAKANGAQIFQAGTRATPEGLVAAGGRVLSVTARGPDVLTAQRAAYAAVERLDFPTGFCRRDIGWREIARGSE